MSLSKVYNASQYETDIYRQWEESGAFKAQPESDKPRYSISMPPPNATGTLHVGHSLGLTIQDILARYARMQGKDVLYLPGTDHAALATNAIMERQLHEEETDKHAIGRDEFVKRLQDFIETSRSTIRNQIRLMGTSCDWSRERYTLDSALNRCVNETFVRMYNDGLIYRGNRIINWDPNLETTISDDEIERVEEKTKFYTFQYGPFQISTARPETKFGDKYVVMHPGDKRYANYKEGDTFEAEWLNGKVQATVIKDKAIDPEFGTGVMTITPWHDHTDFEIAERHNLDKEQIIDFKGRLLPIAQEFAGMPIHEARPLIVEKLKEKGLVVAVDDNYMHSIARNSRGKGIIEPQIKLQWFVDVNKKAVNWKGQKLSLKEVMHNVVADGDINIVPARFDKTYFHWIDNLNDWCISRQIWWGHRIPVWYGKVDGREEVYVDKTPPEGSQWEQDHDTLDTWFSSALWTWSTLIDPKLAQNYSLSLDDILSQSIDFQTYHPTSVMETGWDILFFWVARMILATTYMLGDVPFKTVYLHGLVRAEDGQKMSKSKPETMIDPLEVIPEYGTDALRLALIHGTSPGNDQRMSIPKIVAQRNFCNKIWNVARYVQATVKDTDNIGEPQAVSPADNWILSKLNELEKSMSKDLDKYRCAEAYENLYHFIWDDFADWYIESSKVETNPSVLKYVLETALKLSHPFAPFVSEAIWQELGWHKNALLALQLWPKTVTANSTETKNFDQIQGLIVQIRNITNTLKVQRPTLFYDQWQDNLKNQVDLIQRMAYLGSVTQINEAVKDGIKLSGVGSNMWLDIKHDNIRQYLSAVETTQANQQKIVDQLNQRLSDTAYLLNAPKSIVDQTNQQLEEAVKKIKSIEEEYRRFQEIVGS
jgi:valyl-tRNA synthetase